MKKFIPFLVFITWFNLSAQIQIVKDVNKGTKGSSLQNFFEFKNQLYFSAELGDEFSSNNSIRKLWKTDGTENGTIQIDNFPDKGYYKTDNFLYFMKGRDLWKTDGIETNSTKIKENLGYNNPVIGVFKDFFYYLEYIDPNLSGLYKTDGSTTDLLLTFPSDEYASTNGTFNGNGLSKLDNNRFVAYINTKTLGLEPYISDGTSAGTYFLKDVGVNTFQTVSAKPSNFYKASDKFLFLNGAKELWATDGTATGTLKLKTFTGTSSSTILGMTSFNNKVYFAFTHELWETDGTEAGTKLVLSNVNGDGGIQIIVNRENDLLLLLQRGIHIFDGTSTTTTRLTTPDITSVRPYSASTPTKTYFVANYKNQGDRVWVTNGTNAGTYSLDPFWPDGRIPNYMNTLGESIIFSGTIGTYDIGELWISDGTNAGTKLLKDINKTGNLNSEPKFQTELNGKIYFSADDNIHGRELFVTDGITTSLLKDINPGFQSSNPNDFYVLNNNIIFKAYTTEKGLELWVTDGTEAGTTLLKDINPTGDGFLNDGRAYVRINQFHKFNNQLYFYANNGTNGMEIWKTDGTTTGTIMLKDINSGTNSSFRDALDARPIFVPYNNELYFYVSRYGLTNNLSSFEMWKTNGTAAGTQLATQINNVTKTGSISAYDFFSFNDELYFYGTNKITNKMHLSRTDKTTGAIINIENTGNTTFYPVKDKVYFKKTQPGVTGDEIWALEKDDSFAIVADIVPGSQGINPTDFFTHNNYLYFAIRNASFQTELWRLSNTTAPEKLFDKTSEIGTSSIEQYFDYVTNGDKLFINTRHYGNPDFVYRMYFVENTGGLTPVLSIQNNDVTYINNNGTGLTFLSAFIDDDFYFTGSIEGKGIELLVSKLDATLSTDAFEASTANTKFDIALFPNPVNSTLYIKSNLAIKKAVIYDVLGKKIMETNKNAIDVSSLKLGMYILKMEDELGKISSAKWIKN